MSGMVLGVILMSYVSEYGEKKALKEIMRKEKEEKEKINLNHRV
jgi:hypothetical protein